MLIRFFGPFAALAEGETEIRLAAPLAMGELIGLLAARYPGLAPYAGIASDAELSAHLVILREGRILRLADQIADRDCVQILLPATGG